MRGNRRHLTRAVSNGGPVGTFLSLKRAGSRAECRASGSLLLKRLEKKLEVGTILSTFSEISGGLRF
jgi:hypothetical protein